jgi:hypothetical protein
LFIFCAFGDGTDVAGVTPLLGQEGWLRIKTIARSDL